MVSFRHGRFRQQAKFLCHQFVQDPDLPIGKLLSDESVTQALTAIQGVWLDRVYPPLVTLWVFLTQVLSADHSCRAAVARLIAHRVCRGERPCSAETGAYCQARKRYRKSSSRHSRVEQVQPWMPVSILRGTGRGVVSTSLTVPPFRCRDTPENQKAYPQNSTQQPGIGFPIARIAAFFSLATGAVIELGICRYAGKGQGEVTLLRQLWDVLCPGDVLITDRLMANWTNIFLMQQRGLELVARLNKANRKADFRRGKRLGRYDHIVSWRKPSSIRSLDRETYQSLPESAIRHRRCGCAWS